MYNDTYREVYTVDRSVKPWGVFLRYKEWFCEEILFNVHRHQENLDNLFNYCFNGGIRYSLINLIVYKTFGVTERLLLIQAQ